MRKIIHIDMDAFFAAVEQRDFHQYRGKPLAVGGGTQRGVVAAASYEARKFGIYSALASKIAIRRCPNLILVRPRFNVYREVSHQIMAIFYNYTNLVEPLSLDEAYLDVTQNKKGQPSATLIAREIKERIRDKVQLTASAGVSFNKFLAKIASDYNKPDGLFVIKPGDAQSFVDRLPVEKFFGVGKVTAGKMHRLGIKTGRDLRAQSEAKLRSHFGKVGSYYFKISRTIDERTVNPIRVVKSVGGERTFEDDISEAGLLLEKLLEIADVIWSRIEKKKSFGYTLTLKVKFNDFRRITRSKTLEKRIDNIESLKGLAKELLLSTSLENKKIRLLGLSVSNFKNKPEIESLEQDLFN